MHRSMARNAIRCVRLAQGSRFPVDTLPEFLDFIGMALRAHRRRDLSCADYFVRIAMAGLATLVTERTMNAAGDI